MRVVLDPGVLISAVVSPSGVCSEIVELIEEGVFDLIVSTKLTGEFRNTLQREHFRRWASLERVDEFVTTILMEAEQCDDPANVPAITRDPKDDYLVALALASVADVLVSGDQDLTELTDAPLTILTPRAFLDRLEQMR